MPQRRSRGKRRGTERQALASAFRRFGSRKDVTGVDVGYKITDGKWTDVVAIRLHVRKKKSLRGLKKSRRFPKTIFGWPVDVIEATYEDQNATLRQRMDPAQPGVSIGRRGDAVGTMGLIVRDNRRSGAPGFLTAAHVLFGGAGAPSDEVMQPADTDNPASATVVGTAGRAFHPSDAVLTLLDRGRTAREFVALTNVRLRAAREPRLGDVLEKCGRGTGVTRGTVDGIGHFMGVRDSFRLVGQTPAQIAAAGDSGAVWYDPATGAVVGLHCKGPVSPAAGNFAIAARLTVVTARLAVTPA